MYAIEVAGLTKRYGKIEALQVLQFTDLTEHTGETVRTLFCRVC